MRSAIVVFAAILSVGLTADAAPLWDAAAMVLSAPGATRFDVTLCAGETIVEVQRTVTSRIELGMSCRASDLFDLEVKLVVLEGLVPLFVAATLGAGGFGVASTLFLGPVQIDWGRVWGEEPLRFVSVQLSARPQLAICLGIEAGAGASEPIAGVRVFPGGHALYEVDVSIRPRGLALSVGGTLR